jgi:hypothetical protein
VTERQTAPTEPPIFLNDVLSRGTAVEWFEAVAIVDEVIEHLAEAPVRGDFVPDLHEIALTADGRITVRAAGAGRSDEPIRRLGQLLQALLIRSEMPVQLRLVISKATSLPAAYASVAELGAGLAYFERPQRSTVLQHVYDRVSAEPASIRASESPTIDTIAPLPVPESSGRARRRLDWRWIRVSAVVAAVAVVSVTAAYYLPTWKPAHDARSRLTAAANQASITTADTIIAGASAITDRMGLGRLVPAEAATMDSEVPTSAVTPIETRHMTPKAAARRSPIAAFDLEPQGMSEGPIPAVVPSISGANDSPDATPVAESIDSSIYAAGAEGVVPPVAIQPYLPRELPSAIRPDNLSRIELVVAVDGTVASVKLLGRVANVRDVMFLSVAKAWQFRPALKNGAPVKYRKTIWIADQ